MKSVLFFYGILLIFLLAFTVLGYSPSTYGKPTEFGNISTTTCWIGGDEGNISCTGSLHFSGSIVGNASINKSDFWDDLNSPSDIPGFSFLYNHSLSIINSFSQFFYNQSRAFNQSIELNPYFKFWINQTESLQYLIYNQSLASYAQYGKFWFNQSLPVYNYVNLNFYNRSGNLNSSSYNITASEFLNASGEKEWISSENVFDIDKEDIEGDLNTFVDIAGDTMTGQLVVEATTSLAKSAGYKYLSLQSSTQDAVIKFLRSDNVLDWEIRDDDGVFKINNKSNSNNMFRIDPDGLVTIPNNLTISEGGRIYFGNTGFYENTANVIKIVHGDAIKWSISEFFLGGASTGASLLTTVVSSAISPGFSFLGDTDTGIGHASNGQISLIGDGKEFARLNQTVGNFTSNLIIQGNLSIGQESNIYFNGSSLIIEVN
jgi:hypothetical protein